MAAQRLCLLLAVLIVYFWEVQVAGDTFPIYVDLDQLNETQGYRYDSTTRIGLDPVTGDVNGDGIDDILFGSGDPPHNAFLLLGTRSSTPNETYIFGPAVGVTSNSFLAMGNVNTDKFADLAIATTIGTETGNVTNQVIVIYGNESTSAMPSNTSSLLTAKNGFIIKSINKTMFGSSIAVADLNQDVYNDIIVGDPLAYTGGALYFFSGIQSGDRVLSPEDADLTIFDATVNTSLGSKIVVADLNGDGIKDVLALGKRKLFCLFNPENGLAEFTMFLAEVLNFTILVPENVEVAAGDLNGDGVDDIAIGDYEQNRVFVIYGSNGLNGKLDLEDANAVTEHGFVIHGSIENDDKFGYKVAFGDINNDGVDDLAVGAPSAGDSNEGAIFVVYGRTTSVDGEFLDDTPIDNFLTPQTGFKVHGVENSFIGSHFCMTGDVSGDGLIDLVIGSPDNSAVWVVYGITSLTVNSTVEVKPGEQIEITVPDPSGGHWTFEARQKNGSGLPTFLTFANLTLSGIVPSDQQTDIFVIVTGRDQEGNPQVQYDYSFLIGSNNLADNEEEPDGDGGDGVSPIAWLIPVLFIVCVLFVCLTIVLSVTVVIVRKKSLLKF
eukprot:TRINITY_DN1926_c0_g1_i1.p1 TRINITY_DN1926_c0_g1~~TRINITY_DN1926_c0_g1_i1.p1  ORF type:complete len:606 (-),score=108.47 TRINITY_DN1926_c0_g1_i1:81-1898(-)